LRSVRPASVCSIDGPLLQKKRFQSKRTAENAREKLREAARTFRWKSAP
jgi:hypothetical protein